MKLNFLHFVPFFLLLICAANSQEQTTESENDSLSQEPLRVCYFTTWARYRSPPFGHLPKNVEPKLCSHIIIAFGWIKSGNLTLHSESEDKRIVRGLNSWKRKYPHLKIMIAVGGWTFGSVPFRWVVGSEANRTQFVDSALHFLEKWKLDGLDIDWEYPEAREKDNFTLLLEEFKENFEFQTLFNGTERFLLTAAVPASIKRLVGYDIPKIQKIFDFVNLMAYDLNGPWNKTTGHNAPLHSYDGNNIVNAVYEWIRRGMPRKKIILGLPLYGHSFYLKNPGITEPGGVSLRGVRGPITQSPGFFSYYEVRK